MLSRLALNTRNVIALPKLPSSKVLSNVCVARTASSQTAVATTEEPERDLVNFPRPVRFMYGSKVRLGFIPEEWFQFFYRKTGVTGPYVFGVGFVTYLLSKEIIVIEHEFWTGFTLALMFTFGIKKFGPIIAATLDRTVDAIEQEWNDEKDNAIKAFETAIENEETEQWRAEGQKYLFDAKRENVHLQLEAEYRRRLMTVYEETKKRLDYQLDCQTIRKKFEHKHMVDWIVRNVIKSITPEQENKALEKCITDLKSLAMRV